MQSAMEWDRVFSGRLTGLAVVSFFAVGGAHAQITPIGSPFNGSLSESFESFPNAVNTSGLFLATPVSVFGGAATFSTTRPSYIFEPGSVPFSLNSSGLAQVTNGTKGLGVSDTNLTGIFTFSNPISQFGGYWGAVTGGLFPDPATISVSFFDSFHAQIGATQTFDYSRSGPRDGLLIWRGWSSSAPITSVRFTGSFVAGDNFQANPSGAAIVPEPGEWATMSFAALGLGGLILRARKHKTA